MALATERPQLVRYSISKIRSILILQPQAKAGEPPREAIEVLTEIFKKESNGNYTLLDFEEATGTELFDHYRHSLTNYDEVWKRIEREETGGISNRQLLWCKQTAAEVVIAYFRNEFNRQQKLASTNQNLIRQLVQKAGVNRAKDLMTFVSKAAYRITSFQNHNDNYRTQKVLVLELLKIEDAAPSTIDKVEQLFAQRGHNKTVKMWQKLTDWESSEILSLLKRSSTTRKISYKL
ncbi:MAG: hypothetical protein WA902_00900 [Thermosynechococcaceae cyanobacterium]